MTIRRLTRSYSRSASTSRCPPDHCPDSTVASFALEASEPFSATVRRGMKRERDSPFHTNLGTGSFIRTKAKTFS